MAIKSSVHCDAPACDKDISLGDGRQWHLTLNSVVTGMKPGSTPRHDFGSVLQLKHFCDEHCLQDWLTQTIAEKDAAQVEFERQKQMKAAAEEAQRAHEAELAAASQQSDEDAEQD